MLIYQAFMVDAKMLTKESQEDITVYMHCRKAGSMEHKGRLSLLCKAVGT